MTRPLRRNQIDLSETCIYHVVSRCVRQLDLLGPDAEGQEWAKSLCLRLLADLVDATAIELAGFALMDNHVHLLLHVDADRAAGWSAVEVARRWSRLHPPRDWRYRRMAEADWPEGHVEDLAADEQWVEVTRAKLMSIPQFMKEFNQHVAQKINRKSGIGGALWQGRYKLKAVVDEAQLLATLCYIDLNPFAAGIGEDPETAGCTSVRQRVGAAAEADDAESTAGASETAAAAATRTTPPCPRRCPRLVPIPPERAARRGLFAGLSMPRYRGVLLTVAQMCRPGKRRLVAGSTPVAGRITPSLQPHPDAQPLLDRLGLSPQALGEAIRRLAEYWSPRPRVAGPG